MNNRLLLSVLLAMSAALYADESDRSETRSLKFSIEKTSRQILRYEPLQLKLVVTNVTENAVETTLPLAALECISVQRGERPFEKWRRGWINWGSTADWPIITVKPGESREYPVELVWQKDYPIFDSVGNYRIKAEWGGTAGRFLAFSEIEVVDGGRREKECLEELHRANCLEWLGLESCHVIAREAAYKKRETWRRDLQLLFEIAKRYSDTTYSQYCLCAVITSIEANVHVKVKSDSIDADFKREVIDWTQQRCAQETDARTLYSYALYLFAKDKYLRGTRHDFQELLENACALDPDVVLASRIKDLARKGQVVLRPDKG